MLVMGYIIDVILSLKLNGQNYGLD